MNSEFNVFENDSAELSEFNADITREVVVEYIAAGILFPEEVRHAEQIIRRMNKKK